ncbi:hypothetical protein COCC4DRAFT_201169 [Bipolaris maydis ATCC 48331]|uniref:Pentacotripeptide-repeat region of PRORP domain-containing protein n=2 Tax=Cochliobolus heterostrophus TaxID=5016 RepID=M2VCE3_COCH5|nr:uncharacterized protein COCC4DRAFT_201169 [Bipolaris maydis ATCC 48331]EMD97687.1 hypothetical protein COCHEDRAFT_1221017 [Bipolaris maydis C5]KAH7564600.1 hypothetical protein BM1_01647 [Bipolaris maydis]ENI02916.1 hypothetical protein COCC4DRAFT_201169 [Bipolaris maydis ATCC 48331]KAJ5060167.1 hypothetical protein J3E74DRAFT_418393 [Bipolaris maydis]KAJ6210962.1 hypothetical protein PSV09DRAFT_1221017 [Bipolaris maydis]
MPRVRVPNASFIASADLPVLLFLAPRAFAESPIPGSTRTHNQRGNAAQKEKQALFALPKCLRRIDGVGEAGKPQLKSDSTCCQHLRQRKLDAGLLQMPTLWRRESHHQSPINFLYAEISTFARQHARAYATTASHPSPPAPTGPPKSYHRRARSGHTSSVLATHAPLRAAKRAKALALERARLLNYVSRLPSNLSQLQRMNHGSYRSLSRRVSNLVHWKSRYLDLRMEAHRYKKIFSLNLAFAALDRALYTSLRQHTRSIVIKHDPRCVQLSRKIFPPDTPISSHMVWKNWVEFDVSTRKAYAHRLLIYLLDRVPGLALRFIQVIANDPLLRGRKTQAIADGLGHLSKIHTRKQYGTRQKWGTDPMAHKRVFVPAFVNIFSKSLASQPDVCSQDLLYNLVGLAEIDDLKKVFDCLAQHRTRIGFDTMLHYASTFGEAGEVEYALKCLEELRVRLNDVAWKSVVERERLRWTCATILRKSMSTSHNFHQTPSIVAAFVRLGIKMDILLYNIVMHNAMEAGDYTTAFKVYNTLESNRLEPNSHTHSILLHGCTLQSNPSIFQDFAQHCADIAQQTKDPWLATDHLYYLYIRHQADVDAGHRSALLWDAYLRFFSMAPLEPFLTSGMMNPGPARTEQDEGSLGSVRLPPPSVALYVMMQAEVQSAAAISNQRVLNLYNKFTSVATQSKDPAFKGLVQNPIVWNAFLLAFSQKQQFANASQVIKDMTESAAKPNVYSWNILMQAFFKTGQVQAAERVFEIMRNRGTDPDQFTYGVLIRGYAKAQLVERIGETMQHLETEQELKPDLLRALAAVVNRRQLMLTLEKDRLYKEVKAHENAAREAEDRRVRWQPPLFKMEDAGVAGVSEEESVGSDVMAIPHTEDVVNSSELPDTPHQQQKVEDADVFGLLKDEQADPAAALPASATSRSARPVSRQPYQELQRPIGQPNSATADARDPEVQYRKLQEQLGLFGHSQPSATGQDSEPQRPEPLGASIGFKSVLGKNKAVVASKSSVSKGRIRPKMKRERLDRPFPNGSKA